MNSTLLIVLRLIHVVGGMLWGGAAVLYLFFVKPTVEFIGSAGLEFMEHLAQRRRYPLFMTVTSTLTILSGGMLLWTTSAGLNQNWFRTDAWMGFSIGAGAALVAYLLWRVIGGPTSAKLSQLGEEIATAGRPPSAEQRRTLQAVKTRLASAEKINFIMLAVAMLAMATARYW